MNKYQSCRDAEKARHLNTLRRIYKDLPDHVIDTVDWMLTSMWTSGHTSGINHYAENLRNFDIQTSVEDDTRVIEDMSNE